MSARHPRSRFFQYDDRAHALGAALPFPVRVQSGLPCRHCPRQRRRLHLCLMGAQHHHRSLGERDIPGRGERRTSHHADRPVTVRQSPGTDPRPAAYEKRRIYIDRAPRIMTPQRSFCQFYSLFISFPLSASPVFAYSVSPAPHPVSSSIQTRTQLLLSRYSSAPLSGLQGSVPLPRHRSSLPPQKQAGTGAAGLQGRSGGS